MQVQLIFKLGGNPAWQVSVVVESQRAETAWELVDCIKEFMATKEGWEEV